MSQVWVLLVTLASCIHISQADCILEMDPSVLILENAFVCMPVNQSLGETEEYFGRRFLTCMNSEVHIFECDRGMAFDVVTTDCRKAPPRCDHNEEISTFPPTPKVTARNASPLPPPTTTTSPSRPASSRVPKTKLTPVKNRKPNVSTTTPTTQPPPVVDSSGVCTAENCKVPNCFCLGAKPQIEVSEAPMIVMLSFDDAVTEAFTVDYYHPLLVENVYSLNNPNNCSIKAAFFLSSANTDYKQVKILYDKGHEFASHTVKHILPDGGTKEEYENEIVGIRDILVSEAKADGKTVEGFRAPYLKLAGNQMFEVLQENNFHYDSSISNIERKKGNSHLWPFTLDFQIPPNKCPNGPCPTKGFPGLWEIPINAWLTADGGHCAMIDACIVANFTDDKKTVRDKYFRYFQKNFYEAFYPEKVPMHLFTHSSVFLRHPESFEALTDFLQEINSLLDVWFLTPSQALDWMKKPVTNDDAANGGVASWNCGDMVHKMANHRKRFV